VYLIISPAYRAEPHGTCTLQTLNELRAVAGAGARGAILAPVTSLTAAA